MMAAQGILIRCQLNTFRIAEQEPYCCHNSACQHLVLSLTTNQALQGLKPYRRIAGLTPSGPILASLPPIRNFKKPGVLEHTVLPSQPRSPLRPRTSMPPVQNLHGSAPAKFDWSLSVDAFRRFCESFCLTASWFQWTNSQVQTHIHRFPCHIVKSLKLLRSK